MRAPALILISMLMLGFAPESPAAQAGSVAWNAFERTWTDVASYSATVTVFERDGTLVQSSVLDYTFVKPATATVHFVAGKNAGVTVDWSGGPTVVAFHSGFLSLIKKSFALHDPQVTSIRGSSIDELSFAAFIEHAHDTPGLVTEAAGPTILDIPTVAVTLVPATPTKDTGLTKEVLELSVPTSLPIRVLGYEGDTLVREVDFSNVQLKGPALAAAPT